MTVEEMKKLEKKIKQGIVFVFIAGTQEHKTNHKL
jgi:hypothetical protein